MSDTPRTDAILPLGSATNPEIPHIALELAGLARTLERENAELRADSAILDFLADERIFDGIHGVDIDEATFDAMAEKDRDDEEAWKLEWRRQFRLAIAKGMPLTASAQQG